MFRCLDNWVASNYGTTRLEAMVQEKNPQPRYIESALKKADFKYVKEFCNKCSRNCAYRGSLEEW